MKSLKFLSPIHSAYLLVTFALGLVASVNIATSQDYSAEEQSISMRIAHTRRLDPRCPPPTVKKGHQCILQEDVVLKATIELASNTKLNCQGHKLRPAVVGTPDEPRTEESEFQPSKPEAAILIHGAKNVKIQNCNIEDFDFGIISIMTKTLDDLEDHHRAVEQLSNKILQNTIDVRTTGLYLLQSDNTLIADNRITYRSVRGRGIVIELNSDQNKIIGNTIVSTDSASTGEVRRFPGGPRVGGIIDIGIHTVQSSIFRQLLNVIINDRLIQIGTPGALQDTDDEFKLDNNLIEGNTLEDIGGVLSTCSLDPDTPCVEETDCSLINKGICLEKVVNGTFAGIQTSFGSANTIIRENILRGGWAIGISFGGISSSTELDGGKQGTCSRDTSRLCIDNTDCTIAGFGKKGTCMGAEKITVNGKSVNILAERNIILGSILGGIHLGQTVGSTVRGNVIEGLSKRGINIVNDAIETGIIERNSIRGSINGIGLTPGTAVGSGGRPMSFGARISLNDITDYHNAAVITSDDYDLLSELSFDGKGNYWGLPCPGFDRTKVLMENGEINPILIVDSHPYNQSVATTPIPSLPATCENPARHRRRPTRNSK